MVVCDSEKSLYGEFFCVLLVFCEAFFEEGHFFLSEFFDR